MPEPPKITTSLADRIARLNATKAQSIERNHAQVQQQVGEIKSKISKYEATGQHEAPLIPKGPFGLGAPITKPDRGLDRMRIASLGVSGGTTFSMDNPNSLSASTGSSRSVSLGRQDQRRLSNLSSDQQPPPSPTHPPSELLPTPPHETSDPLNQPTKEDHHSSQEAANRSFDSAEAYDGILEGYPTTPAEEDCSPMVTCSNCSRSVQLELLGEHICQQSNPSNRTKSPTDQSNQESEQPPIDVPVDAVESPSLVISQEHAPESPKDQSPPSPSSICSSSNPTHDPSITTRTAASTNAHLSPTVAPSEPLRPPTPVIKETDDQPSSKLGSSPEISPSPKKDPRLQATNRHSDSSHSTNTTRLSTGPLPPSSSSVGRRSWYDEDDDPDYYDSGNTTGFVTIVRSSKRS